MSRPNLVRLGGLAAAFGGLLSATISTLNFVLILWIGRPLEAFARGPLFALLELVGVFIALSLTVGLTGLYALLGRRSRLGISGLILACLSVLASLSFIVFAVVYIVYQLLTDTDGLVRNPWAVFPENGVDLAGALLLAGGVLLLGVASTKARLLGHWSTLPLILGFLVALPPLFRLALLLLPPAGVPWVLYFRPLTILRGLCWILLGIVMWAYASRREPSAMHSASAS